MLKFEMKKREEETVFLRKQKAEIEAYVRKLEESNNELRQFAHITSHDLREPLRMIGGYVGLIEKRLSTILKDDEKEYLQYVTKGVKRMDELIRDILTYTKLNQQFELKPIDLNVILESVLSNLTLEINTRSAFISYEQLPVIQADSSQMTQLFQNIIGNSIKYNTSITPSVSIIANGTTIRIEDNGIGIATEHRESVFEIFNRLHPENKFSGTGMGLAICKKIMNRIGGSIHIEDAVLGGVCFVLQFPE
jgi:light-regulated signal transduction histidine kinase (bacteriophytochrome)